MLTIDNLHEYQKTAINFIIEKKRCALWIGMGLGKTSITLTAINNLLKNNEIERALVIAPLRVAKSVWVQETQKWQHLRTMSSSVAVGNPNKRNEILQADQQLTVIGRDNVKWLVENYSDFWRWDCVIIDESSSFKNPSTQRFKFLRKVIRKTEVCVLLSGTPSPNSYLDLWSQFFLLDFGKRLFKNFYSFKANFFDENIYTHEIKIKEGASKIIRKNIKDITLSLRTNDYLTLPKLLFFKEEIEFNCEARKIYKKLANDYFLKIDETTKIDAANSAVLVNKLLQVTSGALYTDDEKNVKLVHNLKLERLEDLLQENETENFIVSYFFQSELQRLKKRFSYARMLDSSAIEDWNAGKIKLLLVHPGAAGHGLNLQFGGATLIYYTTPWSLELYEQMNARLYRQGQTQIVRIFHLVIKNSVDEIVLERLSDKSTSQQQLLEKLRRISC